MARCAKRLEIVDAFGDATDALDGMLGELRATSDISNRREIAQAQGKRVGEFCNAIDALVRISELPEVYRCWADEVTDLCQIKLASLPRPAASEATVILQRVSDKQPE